MEGGRTREEDRVEKRETKENRGIKASSGSERKTRREAKRGESKKKKKQKWVCVTRKKRLTESDRASLKNRERESIITEVEPQGSSMDH